MITPREAWDRIKNEIEEQELHIDPDDIDAVEEAIFQLSGLQY